MTVNINAANITSIRLAEQSSNPSTPASGFASLFVDTNGDLATRKDAGGIKIATSPASGDWILTVDGTGTAARLNAANVFTSAQVMPAGTNSAPALTTTGDTNTGIYFPAADNIGFSTGGTIRGRWTTDGLCFGSDTAAANALDDYEEGTWTPLIVGSTSAGTATYTAQSGIYTRIGRVVHIQADIGWNSGDGSGNLQVHGLPFASVAGVYAPVTIAYWENITLSASSVATAYVQISSQHIRFNQYPLSGGSVSFVSYDAAGRMFLQSVYTV